jgi:hypothetical protein
VDKAASGYVPLRFVRALSASFVVAAVFGILAITAGASFYAIAQGGWDAVVVAPLGIGLVLLLFVLPVAIFVALVGGIIDLAHRRVVGFALLVASVVAVLFFAAGVIYSAGWLAGFDMRTASDPQPMPVSEAFWFGLFGLFAAITAFEVMRAGWWQFTTSAEDFRAIRGWRPSVRRPLTSFRRYLGLPSFLSYVGKKRGVASLLYFGVAVLNLGLVLLLVLPTMIGSQPDQGETFNPLILYGVMIALLLLNLVGAGAFLARLADRRATTLYQNVRDWDERAPIVFLRAFDQDAARLRTRGGDLFARWPAGVGRSRTLDEILLEHGSPYGPVIAIGDPRDPTPPLGAARVFVEGAGEQWQDVVRALAGASRAIVMCPNHGEGVQWELDLITQAGGRLQTIFLASPELDREASTALFGRIVPAMPELESRQWPLAAYVHQGVWRVLTTKRLSVEAYTAALNTALQELFGLKGVAFKKPRH